MKKQITIIALLVIFSTTAFSQSVTKQNGLTDSVALWNKHVDSVLSNTSIKVFQNWLYESATVKQYQEGRFVDLYNAFIQSQYNIWIASKSQPKK